MRDDLFLLVLVRQHQAFTKSPFNEYHKSFVSHDGRSAEDRFWDWWNQLPEDSYTKKMGKVQFIWCTTEGDHLLERPNAEVIHLRPS